MRPTPVTSPYNNSARYKKKKKKNFQQDSFIAVVSARKGKAVVVMDMVEYTEKVGGLPNDDNT